MNVSDIEDRVYQRSNECKMSVYCTDPNRHPQCMITHGHSTGCYVRSSLAQTRARAWVWESVHLIVHGPIDVLSRRHELLAQHASHNRFTPKKLQNSSKSTAFEPSSSIWSKHAFTTFGSTFSPANESTQTRIVVGIDETTKHRSVPEQLNHGVGKCTAHRKLSAQGPTPRCDLVPRYYPHPVITYISCSSTQQRHTVRA